MSDRAADLFERQYGQGALSYRQAFPGLRRLLQPWARDRAAVTRDVVAALCATPGRRRVLDFGCGDGALVRAVAASAPAGIAELVGVDLSPSRVAQADELQAGTDPAAPRTRFVVGDEAAIAGVREEGFDVVTCIAVLSQVYDVYGLGRALRDALVPGGHLVAEFQNYAYVRQRLALMAGRVPTVSPAPQDLWPEVGWDSGHVHHFSLRTAVRFLEQCGLTAVAKHPTGLLASLLPLRPSLFATGFVLVARRTA